MDILQGGKRKRDTTEQVDFDARRLPPNGDSKKRQHSPEKPDRDHDRQKRARRDEERGDESRRDSDRPHQSGDRDRQRNGERQDRERDGERHDRDRRGRGEGKHERDNRRDDDRRHGDRRDADRRDRDRNARNGDHGSPSLPPSAAKPSSSRSTVPPSKQSASGSPAAQPDPKSEPLDPEEEETAQMKQLMGFATFRSTKDTKVPGNDKLYGVRKEKKTEYRQYMNRVGGFNRPLSPSRQ